MGGKTALFILAALVIIALLAGSGKPPGGNGPGDGWR